jgi:hypothetical protein
MQVIRQHHDCINREGPSALDLPKGCAESINAVYQQAAFAFQQGDREEEGSAGCMAADVLRHSDSVPQGRGRRITLR